MCMHWWCKLDCKYGRLWWFAPAVLMCLALLVSCNIGDDLEESGSAAPVDKAPAEGWEKVIYQCIATVQQSDAVFYRRGKQVSGRELAREMRNNLRIVLRHKSIPEPFGRNAGVLLVVITTHEGYAMDGITGPPAAYEVAVGGRRMKVYDWLKAELGLKELPGEEEGHQILVPLYEPVLTDELLKQWEGYIDRCIEVAGQAEDCRFYLGGKWLSASEAAELLSSNRAAALKRLLEPEIKHPEEKEWYTSTSVLSALTFVWLLKRPEEYPDRAEYVRAVDRMHREVGKKWVDCNGVRKDMILWLEQKAGEPPPMPKLKKKGKGSG